MDGADLRRFSELVDDDTNGDTLVHVAKQGNLKDTRRAVSLEQDVPGLEDDVVWLENGNDAAGFEHILKRHGTADQFYDMPGVDAPSDIENLIMKAVKNGDRSQIPVSDGGGTAFTYTRSSGDRITVIAGDNGFIVTARPGGYNR